MGYVKQVGIDTLELPSNPEFKVRMRARALHGLIRVAQSAMIQVDTTYADPDTGKPLDQPKMLSKAEFGAYVTALLLGDPREGVPGLLVDWNLTDENDQPLPLNAAGLDKLEGEDGQFLQNEANKRSSLRGKKAEQDFKTPSS